MLFAPEDDENVTEATGNDAVAEGFGLIADRDGAEDKHSIYDNDADEPL